MSCHIPLYPPGGSENWKKLCTHLEPLHEPTIDENCKAILKDPENLPPWPHENSGQKMKTVYAVLSALTVLFQCLPGLLVGLFLIVRKRCAGGQGSGKEEGAGEGGGAAKKVQ